MVRKPLFLILLLSAVGFADTGFKDTIQFTELDGSPKCMAGQVKVGNGQLTCSGQTATLTITGGSGGSSSLAVNQSGVQISSPTSALNFVGPPFSVTQVGGTTAQITLNASSVTLQGQNVINLTSTLQSGATFFVSSGTVNGQFITSGSNMNMIYQPGTGTGGTGYLWAQGASTFAPAKFDLVYSALGNGTTVSHLLFDTNTPQWSFQNGSGVTIASVTTAGVITGSSIRANDLVSGQCVQAGTNGLLTVTGSACGSGSGGSGYAVAPATVQFNLAQGVTGTTFTFTGPSQSTVTYGLSVGSLTVTNATTGNLSITENSITGQIVLSTAGTGVTVGHCAQFGSSMTVVDAGANCGTGSGSGSGSGTITASTQYQVPFYSVSGSSNVISSSPNFTNNGSTISMVGIQTIIETNFSSETATNAMFTYTSSSMTISSLTVSGTSFGVNNLQYSWPSSQSSNYLKNDGSGNLTWAAASGGGGSSTLAVTTGTSAGFTGGAVSSPTAVAIFDSATMGVALQGTATAFMTLSPSSVTLQGNSVSLSGLSTSVTNLGTSTGTLRTLADTKINIASITATVPITFSAGGVIATQLISLSSAVVGFLPASNMNQVSLSSSVVGVLPTANMVSTAAFTNSTMTWTAGQTFISSVTHTGAVLISTTIIANGSTGSNGQFLTSGGAGAVATWTTGSGTPNGSNFNVQISSAGSFAGVSGFNVNQSSIVISNAYTTYTSTLNVSSSMTITSISNLDFNNQVGVVNTLGISGSTMSLTALAVTATSATVTGSAGANVTYGITVGSITTGGIFDSSSPIKTGDYTMTKADMVILSSVSMSASSATLTLPTGNDGQTVYIWKVDSDSVPVVIKTQGSDTIAFSTANFRLRAQGQGVELTYNSSRSVWLPQGGLIAPIPYVGGHCMNDPNTGTTVATSSNVYFNAEYVPAPAVVYGIRFEVTTTGGSMVVALYDSTGANATPGTLLSSSTLTAVPVGGSTWATINFQTPVLVSPGTYYLAMSVNNAVASFNRCGLSSGLGSFLQTQSNTMVMPNPASTSTSAVGRVFSLIGLVYGGLIL